MLLLSKGVWLSLAIAPEASVRAVEAERDSVTHVQSNRDMSARCLSPLFLYNCGKRALVGICDKAILKDSTLAKPLILGLDT